MQSCHQSFGLLKSTSYYVATYSYRTQTVVEKKTGYRLNDSYVFSDLDSITAILFCTYSINDIKSIDKNESVQLVHCKK